MSEPTVRIDGVIWFIWTDAQMKRHPQPLCPRHHLRMQPINSGGWSDEAKTLKCEDCTSYYPIPRKYQEQKQYVIDRIDAKLFKNLKVINLDDEAIPIAKTKVMPKDSRFFVTAQLMESKRGLQAVIYAGEKGKVAKTQIFVEPATKRLAFDHTNLHPTDIFLKVEATFDDGSKQIIEK